MKLLKLFLLIIVLITPACTAVAAGTKPTGPTSSGVPAPEAPAAASPHAQLDLVQTRWVLESFGAPGAETPVMAGSHITLEFGADGRVTGTGGCNSYGGTYQMQDKILSFSQMVSTLMACAETKVMQQEQQYLEALRSASQFELADDRLTLFYEGGQRVLNFTRASPTALAPAETTTTTTTTTTPPPPSSSTSAPAAEAYENLNSPVDLLASYLNAINRQEYQRAYNYWESPPNAYEEFGRGFADTVSVQLIVQPPTHIEGAAGSVYVEIPTVFIARHQDGSDHTFAGCFVTRKSNLHPPDIPAEDVWHLYQARMAAVPNDAAIPGLLAQACSS